LAVRQLAAFPLFQYNGRNCIFLVCMEQGIFLLKYRELLSIAKQYLQNLDQKSIETTPETAQYFKKYAKYKASAPRTPSPQQASFVAPPIKKQIPPPEPRKIIAPQLPVAQHPLEKDSIPPKFLFLPHTAVKQQDNFSFFASLESLRKPLPNLAFLQAPCLDEKAKMKMEAWKAKFPPRAIATFVDPESKIVPFLKTVYEAIFTKIGPAKIYHLPQTADAIELTILAQCSHLSCLICVTDDASKGRCEQFFSHLPIEEEKIVDPQLVTYLGKVFSCPLYKFHVTSKLPDDPESKALLWKQLRKACQ